MPFFADDAKNACFCFFSNKIAKKLLTMVESYVEKLIKNNGEKLFALPLTIFEILMFKGFEHYSPHGSIKKEKISHNFLAI